MIIITEEAMRPLACGDCGSTQIANMVNEGVIRCLLCRKEKEDPNSLRSLMRRETGHGNSWTYTTKERRVF